jgi:hypothetical protein
MLELSQILSRCTDEQLESLMEASHTIMQHFEYVTGHTATYLAGENEQYWKVYGINALAFSELAARAQGKSHRNPYPLVTD